MILEFDCKGNDKQKLCWQYWADNTTTDIVYGGSKGSAKSFTGAACIFSSALIYPNTHWFAARKVLLDLKKFTIPSILEVLTILNVDNSYYTYKGDTNTFNLYNGSKVFLLAAKYIPTDPHYTRFGSMQMTGGWIEEAGEFTEDCKRNLQISIGRWNNDLYGLKGKLLQTCNPTKNYLYTRYYKPYKEGNLPNYAKFVQALPTDNKMLGKDYLDNLENTLTGEEKKRLLYGDWEYDESPNRLINYTSILDSFTNDFVYVNTYNRYMTVDIAMEGSDLFVILIWYGWVCVDYKEMKKSDGKEIVDAINEMKSKHKIQNTNIAYDNDGLGGFVKGFFFGAISISNGGKPYNREPYENLKTQLTYKLAQKMNKNEVYLQALVNKRQYVADELALVEKDNSGDNKVLKIVKKSMMKSMLGRSPDYYDAIAYRMVFEYLKLEGLK